MTTLTILAKVGTLPLARVEVVRPRPFRVITGDRCVIRLLPYGREISCLVDRIVGGTPNGRPVYYLSQH